MSVTKEPNSIFAAAYRVFVRYGISKATMTDVAKEAGVSRQTLYNSFKTKELLISALIKTQFETSREQISFSWASCETLDEKLEIFFQQGPLAWFDLIQKSPHYEDLIEGVDKNCKQELAQQQKKWVDLLAKELASFEPILKTHGHSPIELADYIYSTSINAKKTASGRANLVQRLQMLKTTVSSFLSE